MSKQPKNQLDLSKNDFYDFVNEKWLKKAKIPKDLSGLSSYSELHLEIERQNKKLVENWASNLALLPTENKQIVEMVKFFKMLRNKEMQLKQGWEPTRNTIEMIQNLKSFKELNENFLEFRAISAWMPYDFSVEEDFINNKIYTLWMNEAGLLLPSKEYYSTKQGTAILKVIAKVAEEMLVDYGFFKYQAKEIVKLAIEFDKSLAEHHLSSEEMHQVEKLYNPISSQELNEISQTFDLLKQAESLVKTKVDQVVLLNPNYIKKLDQIFVEKNFVKARALMLLTTILSFGQYLNPLTRKMFFPISQTLTGAEQPKSNSKWVFHKTLEYFAEPFSLYYGQKNFPNEAKQDVLKMIDKVVKVYQERLKKNTWLTPETAQKAISKLNKIRPMVGYPDYIPSFYDQFIVKTYHEKGSLTENIDNFERIMDEYNFSKYKKEVDPNLWGMMSYEVNAYFNPLMNVIVFPAGYLKAPFYDYNQNSSANYGGLGMTIGHEISHAFDNNGAQFDEQGSFQNWWTDKDYEAFKEKTQLMIEMFDGYETPFGKINGKLTVSENIADQGGIISALEAAKSEPDFNIEEFFRNYAYCERGIIRKEAAIRRLLSDPHSPAKERVNLQLKLSKEFQEHYNLSKYDKMYYPIEKIFEIW
ncbi:M13 family metallopeptidase [Mycoplasmopsis gallopavonis]|uniref:Neutral endopeptidase n=1 Tax=Mycoplasmopsis gallopavonis TaxID=76629 RepID=A0A449AYM7_9BACT|nr:M13 family metallopeptidase [Mycoplasmopsis gallopavonis]RIV16509.1 M13 family peptidase [Mycoplasmopsis gallopavonis]VEU72604.1 Neutral endopeptidase [Mycoplasmopsis gallopavonis]